MIHKRIRKCPCCGAHIPTRKDSVRGVVITYLRGRDPNVLRTGIDNLVNRVQERFPKRFASIPSKSEIKREIKKMAEEGEIIYDQGARGQQCVRLNTQQDLSEVGY